MKVPSTTAVHSMPSIRPATKLQGCAHKRLGIRPEGWRLNFTRVDYVGSVGVQIMVDELARAGALHAGDTVCAVAEESSK